MFVPRFFVGWLLALVIVVIVTLVPYVHYRAGYVASKRVRVVDEEKFVRSGQMNADGMRSVMKEYGIRTVINLQEEDRDPLLSDGYFGKPHVRESEICAEFGADYRLLEFDLLPRDRLPHERPAVIDHFLRILDDPESYPILLHCRAGLHRTGLLTAIYRIEYQGWSRGAAVRELRANGFGDPACTVANEYLLQFLEYYRPGVRRLPASDVLYAAFGVTVRAKVPPTLASLRGEGTP
jgi:tyrosine-protein phosphatase SIW14